MTEAVEIGTERWRAEVAHYLPLIARVIVQTQRRVPDGEIVPASEKLVSLFEPHADIIVKGSRQVQYGYKLNLATGKSGLILDVVIETGNPADAERFLSMLDRHIARTGAPPWETAAGGGYASRANLATAKARGCRRRLPQEVRHRHYRDGQEPLGLPSSAPLPRRHAAVRDGNLWSLASSAARRVVPLISYLEREGRGLRLKAVPVATENRIWAGQMPRWAILISG